MKFNVIFVVSLPCNLNLLAEAVNVRQTLNAKKRKKRKSIGHVHLPIIYIKFYVLLGTNFKFLFCLKEKSNGLKCMAKKDNSELYINITNVSPYESSVFGLLPGAKKTPGFPVSLRYDSA